MKEIITKDMPQYKANLHCHSTLSDGALTPEELKRAYRERGYSVLAITDHERPYDHSSMTEDDFLMLTGYEAYIRPSELGVFNPFRPEIHINLFAKKPSNTAYVGYQPCYDKYTKDPKQREAYTKVGPYRNREYSVDYVNEFVKEANENGYLCSYNHPYWSQELHEVIAAYEGFFSMEICNYSSYVVNGCEYNAALYDRLLRDGKRIFCHSADDNHNKHPLDSPYSDSFGGFTMILADKLDYQSIISALEEGRFYSSMGPIIHSLRIGDGKIEVECSSAKQITVHYGSKATRFARGTKESPISSYTTDIPRGAEFIRISVVDFDGRYADTRAFFLDELV